uniref:Uncharacterized protein n=1 Tax=Arundo donax TaxID=35708 RepID=A0A0A9GT47_ARUDO
MEISMESPEMPVPG